MNKKKIALAALVLAAIVLVVVKFNTMPDDVSAIARYGKALAYGLMPWVLGGLLSIVIYWSREQQNRSGNFTTILLSTTGFFSASLLAMNIMTAMNSEDSSLRNDAITVLRARTYVIGLVKLCDASVKSNPRLVAASRQWDKKNRSALDHAEIALEKVGGITNKGRKIIDRMTISFIKREISRYADKIAYCDQALKTLKAGSLDIKARQDTSAALEHIIANEMNESGP